MRRDAEVNRRYAEELSREHPPKESNRDESQSPRGKSPGPTDDGKPHSADPQVDENGTNPDGGVPPGEHSGGNRGGTAPPRGTTPRDQLNAALDSIRAEAERRRIPDQPALDPDVGRKDW